VSNEKIYSPKDNNVYKLFFFCSYMHYKKSFIAKKCIVAVFFLSLLLILSLSVSATTYNVRFNATADSYIDQFYSDTNYGSSSVLKVRSSLLKEKTIFVKFDLSSIPSNAEINSAKLYLYMFKAPQHSRKISINEVKGDWNESNITYNNMPSVGSYIGFLTSGGGSNVWLSWDVTPHLPKNGYAIWDDQSGGILPAEFRSRENLTYVPYLMVSYTVDETAPTCTVDYLENKDSKNKYYFTSPAYINENGQFYVYGTASDTESAIDNVQYNRTSPNDYETWENADPVDVVFNELNEEWKTDFKYYHFIDGWHEICCRAVDEMGNTGEGTCEEFCIDTQDPNAVTNLEADFEDCTGDNTYANTDCVKWTWNSAEDNGCAGIDYYVVKLYYSNGTWINTTNTEDAEIEFCDLKDGEDYFIKVKAVDKAANVGPAATSDEVIIDLTKPGYSILSPPERWFKEDFTVDILMYDNIGLCNCSIKIEDINDPTPKIYEKPCFCNTSIQFHQLVTVGPSGDCYTIGSDTCKVWAYVKDKANNYWYYNKSDYSIDYEPPVTSKTVGQPKYPGPSILWPLVQWFVKPTTPITFNCSDGDGSGCNITYYQITYPDNTQSGWLNSTSWPFTIYLNQGDGVYYIEYYSVDNIGNEEEKRNETDKIDTLAPEIEKWYGLPNIPGWRIIQGINMSVHYITSQTPIYLNATDTEVGVNETWWTLFVPSSEEGMPEWYGRETNKIYESEEDCYEENEICDVTYWYPKYDYMLQYCPEENIRYIMPWEVYWCLYEEPITINQECDHKICYLSIDKLGNYNWPPECQVFSVDNEGPEFSILNNFSEGMNIKCQQSIVINISDEKSGVKGARVEWYNESNDLTASQNMTYDEGTNAWQVTFNELWRWKEGNYTVKIIAYDSLNNEKVQISNVTLPKGVICASIQQPCVISNPELGGTCKAKMHVGIRGGNGVMMDMEDLFGVAPQNLSARISNTSSSEGAVSIGNVNYIGEPQWNGGQLKISDNYYTDGFFWVHLTIPPNLNGKYPFENYAYYYLKAVRM